MTETTVFQSGNSQAVRLPKEFRFNSKTVEIFRRGNEVVLRERPRTVGELLDSLPPLTEEEAEQIRLTFKDVRDTSPMEDRNWDEWFDQADSQKTKTARPTSAGTRVRKKVKTAAAPKKASIAAAAKSIKPAKALKNGAR
jgi:antitoxin VapB